MHKQIIGALVVGLAGACWMVAQYAVGQPTVAPVNGSSIPPLIDVGDHRLPPLPGAPPETTPPATPSAPSIAPITTLTSSNPTGESTGGPEMAMPSIPPPPLPEETPKNQPRTTPAISGFPALPPIPGAAQAPPLLLVNRPGEVGDPQWTGPDNIDATGMPGVTGRRSGPGLFRNRGSEGTDGPATESVTNLPVRQLGPQIWGGIDYLMWFARRSQVPNLVQSLPVPKGQQTADLSQATTLFPSSGGINYNPMSGLKGTLGLWLNPMQTLGLEANYFWFGDNTHIDASQGGGNSAIGHPYTNAVTGNHAIDAISSTGGTNGSSTIRSGFRIDGGDGNLLLSPSVRMGNFSMLLGFRYLDLQEYLKIDDNSTSSASSLAASDSFTTRNRFFGGQTGLRYSWIGETFTLNAAGKIAYGAMNQSVGIDGSSTMTTASGSTTRSGGIYALNSNIGNYSQTTMAFIPEFNANLGWRITPWATATLGYQFLFISQVVRPGGQIDSTINPNNSPFNSTSTASTIAKPGFTFHNESFWMQGVNIGMTFQY